jgi:dTDP-4-amino-4,6-dideoxygalactose transaminase
MHLQPVFQRFPSYEGGVSEKLFAQGLCLPSGSGLDKAELKKVTALVSSRINKS